MIVSLPITQDSANFDFAVELAGITWTFGFRWNRRGEMWVMTVGDGEGTPLVSGVFVVINTPLLRGRLPALPGDIIAIDSSGQGLDAAFEDLGRRVELFHYLPEDLA
jgi:hypothetical protein